MLYTILGALASYYLMVFAVGIMVNLSVIEGTLITFAVVCYLGAYLTRRYSRLVYRSSLGLGVACTAIVVLNWVFLPIMNTKLVTIGAIVAGLAIYVCSRRVVYRRFVRRTDGSRPAPPFGREWCRYLFLFVL